MHKTIRERMAYLGLITLLFLGVYGIGRHSSPAIVAYVVEQALLQKAPDGIDPRLVRERFESWLASASPGSKLLKLIALSSYLEKVQKLAPAEMDGLLTVGTDAPSTGS